MRAALNRNLVGRAGQADLRAYLRARLPRLEPPRSAAEWRRRATTVRRRVLELFFRGHPPGLLDLPPRVEWLDTLDPGGGYRVRKLRYEGYPGMWIPALLYEPQGLAGRVPAVLNANGHHAGGKAMAYKQARCINLAKRGMLALSTEFIGMGELRADADHNRIAHLDLCGQAGVAVFYLAMKRGLDVLLAHGRTDPARVAMTGLSGGGWQTAVLSALDERIRVIVPVAGHSPVWQRVGCQADIGDLEQDPADLCTIADYDLLTALFAPRPALLIYNHDDDCCFQTRRTRQSVYRRAKPVYELLGVPDRLRLYDNTDPGTHNYDADNRRQLYRFLDEFFGLRTADGDLLWEDEIRSEQELSVGLPPHQETLLSLAHRALGPRGPRAALASSPAVARWRLRRILRVPAARGHQARAASRPYRRGDMCLRQAVLRVDDAWSLPVTECVRPEAAAPQPQLIVADGGRRSCLAVARAAADRGRRVFVADLLGTGELPASWQCFMLLGTAGERPLGILVRQLLALESWIAAGCGQPCHVEASGQVMPVVALAAAALEPALVQSLTAAGLLDSLRRLLDWPVAYNTAAPLFCPGLLPSFDLDALIELAAPVPVHDAGRGPLRARH